MMLRGRSRPAHPIVLGLVLVVLGWVTPLYAQPAGLLPGDTYQLVYVTSSETTVTTDRTVPPGSFVQFGGVPAAQWIVTFHAAVAGASNPFGLSSLHYSTGDPNGPAWGFIEPVWEVILSDSGFSGIGGDARTRIPITGPVYNTNGELVAADHADLWDGTIGAPIKYDEFGNEVTGNLDAWGGTVSSGFWTGSSCDDWDDPSSSNSADTGKVDAVNSGWLNSSIRACNQSARLYGISPELTVLLPGDVNGDWQVDAADYQAWRAGYGATNARLMDGDLNADGAVNAADFTVWRDHLGSSVPHLVAPAGVSTAPPVPEPGSAVLLLLLLLGLAGRHYRLARR